MTSAATLEVLQRHMALIGTDKEAWFDLYATDGVFQLPYLGSVGMPTRWQGREEISGFMTPFLESVENFHFVDPHIFEAADPNMVFADYMVEATIKASGRHYRQLYGARMVVEDGKIKLLTEYLDTVATANALLPNGLADLIAQG